jgi:hypothetical protein
MTRKPRITWIQLSIRGSITVLRSSLIIIPFHPCRASRSASQSGDQGSQNMCEKSSQKHILKLAQKKPAQQKFEFFE